MTADAWTQVRWAEARQITEAMGQAEETWPEPGIGPQAHLATLRSAGERAEAIQFLGHALPRFEALAWASRILEQEAGARQLRPRDRQALDYALRWLGEPNDARRRSAMDAAQAASADAPERLLATAVFLSGGSVAPIDMPPVMPAPELAGKLAALAIVVASGRAASPDEMLDRALDLGERIAAKGAIILEAA